MFDQLISYLSIPWVGLVVGSVIGIIGIFSPKIFKNKAIPAFQKASLRLIGTDEDNLPKNVEILFDGKKIDRLTRTNLIIWNNGNDVLRGSDVAFKDPLLITFSDGEILSYEINKITTEANNFELVNTENSASIGFKFDYLNPKDGVNIGIVHTSTERHPKVSGSIKGIQKGFLDYGRVLFETNTFSNKPFFRKFKPIYFLITIVLIGIIMMYLGTFSSVERQVLLSFPFEDSESGSIMMIVSGAIYALFGLVMIKNTFKKYPKELDSIQNDTLA